LHRGKVLLVGIEQFAGKLGGLAEAQRQQAGSQWIQRSRMPGLFGAIQATRGLQGMIGRNARAPCPATARHPAGDVVLESMR
jgi:hypothetical protein